MNVDKDEKQYTSLLESAIQWTVCVFLEHLLTWKSVGKFSFRVFATIANIYNHPILPAGDNEQESNLLCHSPVFDLCIGLIIGRRVCLK